MLKTLPFHSILQRARLTGLVQALLVFIAILIGSDGFFGFITRTVFTSRWLDFQVYYLSAQLLNRSVPVYSVPARTVLGGELDLTPMVYNYPPFFTALLRPLALLPFHEAGLVWLGMSLGAMVLCVLILAHVLHLSVWQTIVLGLIALFMPATRATLQVGQISWLLTLVLVTILATASGSKASRGDWIAGILIGVAAGIKVYPILLAAPFLFQRRWKVLAIVGSTFLVTLLVGILAGGGIQEALTFWTQILPQASELNLYPPNQSARAVIQRLFEAYPMDTTLRNKAVTILLIPLLDAPMLGRIIGWAVVAAIGGVTGFVLWRRAQQTPILDSFRYNFALIIPAVLMIIPLSWDHYEPHLILSLAVAGLYKTGKTLPRLLFALSCLFLVVHRYWNVTLFSTTPYAALMMFGFVGTLCIWLALLWDPLPEPQSAT